MIGKFGRRIINHQPSFVGQAGEFFGQSNYFRQQRVGSCAFTKTAPDRAANTTSR